MTVYVEEYPCMWWNGMEETHATKTKAGRRAVTGGVRLVTGP